jgi:hypothetical protein
VLLPTLFLLHTFWETGQVKAMKPSTAHTRERQPVQKPTKIVNNQYPWF